MENHGTTERQLHKTKEPELVSTCKNRHVIPEERISHPPTGSTTISLGLSRFSHIRTVLMVPSVLETSIRSVPTKVQKEKTRSKFLWFQRSKAKPIHITMHFFFPHPSVHRWKPGKKRGSKCHLPLDLSSHVCGCHWCRVLYECKPALP